VARQLAAMTKANSPAKSGSATERASGPRGIFGCACWRMADRVADVVSDCETFSRQRRRGNLTALQKCHRWRR
jgi:hypothetical protein